MTNLTPPQTTVGSRWRGFSNPYRALCAILAVLQLFLPSLVVALPSDGNVVGGHATIQQVNPHQLDIQQTTDKAILNWKSFSIAGDETVHFMQPSVSSIALNRVVGTDPSVILGHLQSNGRIFLLNPNGILFGAGAQIDVGGLLATTLQIRDEDFMAGRYLFAQDPLKGLRTVINRGTIQVSDHGFVFLAAPGVSNEGLIVANLGTVVLGSGQALTVDLMGDGLINYALSGKVLDHVMGVDGKPLSSAVSNTGTIQADGGHVVLHAKAAGEIFSSVVNQSGVIRARSLESHGGVVQLLGGDETLVAATAAGAMRPAGDVSGAVVNTGMIDVAAGAPNAAQGSVTMAGERVGQFGSIVATGGEGANGGDVLIASTTRTLLASGSTIDVSGIGHSSGGRLRVWSDHNTFFDSGATILARGGELGGNGGFVELSGKETLGFAGMVNALAPFGSAGTLLLDPRNITIATAGGVAYNNGLNNLFGNNVGATTTITPASINGQLTNVVLQANNDITVTNAIAMTNAGVGITMQAGRSIAVNANVSTNNGNISLTANDSSAIAADRAAGAGNITMAGGTTLNAGTGSLSLTIDSSAVGGFTPGTITAQTLAGGAKTITTATGTSIMNGVISGVGGLTKNGVGALTLSGNNTYTGATTINAGTLQLGAANRISNASALTVAGGATFNLNNFAETIGSLSGAGNVTLGTGRLTTGGNNTSTTYSGIMSGTGGLTKAGTGIFTFSGANTYTGATVINAGTLQVAGGAAIADTSAVSLANVAGTTLDLNGTNETIGSLAGGGATGGNVSLGVGTLTAGGNNTSTTYSGVMSGTGGLTKAGTGIFTLSGVNTYTGATTINAGTLRLGAANRIADTSALTVAGGATFNLNNFAETIGSLAGAGNVTLGTGTLTAGGDNTATIYSGIMSGTGGLTKQGAGVFTLSGNNTYTGATTINAGTVQLGAADRIANTSAVTVAGGATFDLNNFAETIGSLAGAGNVTLGTGIVTTGGNNTSTTYSGVMSGTGGLTKAGTGIFTLSGVNTYTGATTINAGTLRLGAANRIADTSALTVAGGATFNLNNFAETIGSLAGAGNVTLGTGTLTAGGDNTATIYSGIMSGTGGLTKQGTGAFTLSGNNTYSGATNINAGTLTLGAANRIANASAVTVAGGATFDLNNFAETIGSLAGAGNVTLGTGIVTTGGNNTSTTYSGVMSGTGGLTKAGTGIFTLSGVITYTGATTINAGTLRVAGGAAIADTSAVTLANVAGAILDLSGTNETIGSLAGGGAAGGNVTLGVGTLTTGGNNTSTTYNGIVSGTGGVTKAGTGAFTLSRANTYSGVTNVSAGTLVAAVNNALGTVSGGTTVANGATLGFSGGINYATAEPITLNAGATLSNLAGNNIFAGPITLAAGSETVTTAAGTTLTSNGVIFGAGALTKDGTGTLIYGGNNTYTGATTVNAGTLQLSAANRIANTNAVTVNAGAIFNLSNFAETIGSLSGAGNVTLGSATLTTGDATSTTFSGVMSGTGGLTKQGTGVFTLSGNNTYTGTTNVNAGTLVAAANNALGTAAGGTTVAAGATLGLSGGVNYSTVEPVTLNGGTLSNLAGNNTFAGPITLAANSAVSVADGTTMTVGGTVNGGSQLIVSSGTGGINFLSAIGGTTPLSSLSAMVGSIALGPVTTVGTQTYTGATTLNGNLTTTNSAITLNSPVTLGANTIMNSGNGAIAMNGTVNGSFTLTANSTGTTTFNGAVGNSTALTSLTTNAGGTTAINSGSVTTSGDQTYNDNVTMNQTTTLTSTGGTITFGGNATNNAAGSGITVDAPTINLTGGTTVATTGNGPLNFFTDTLNPNSASIDARAGVFSLAPSVLTRTIEFGDVNTGRVTDVYYGSNFAGVTAGSFTIGRPTHTGNIFVTGVAAAPSAINIVNGGTGSVTFETASYVSGDNNFGVVGGSGGITIGSSLTLGTGTLRLTTTGAITQTAGSLTADTAGLSAASGINVVQPANNVTTLAAQTTAGNLAFTDTNGFTIDSISATVDGFHPAITDLAASAGSITLQSGGAVTQTQKILASTLNLQGSGSYTLTNSANDVVSLAANTTGNVQYNNANALVLGASTVSGSFDVIAGGAITQSGAVAVTGTTTLAAGAANDITLTNAGNDFSTVGITSGNNVSLTDTNALVLGSSTVSGNLNVTTNGALTQSGAATVAGTATLAAGAANDITLTNAGNNFSIVGISSGNNVSLTDANALVLGASTVSGNLALTTGGTLSQTGALAVIGTTSFSATAANTDILLDTQGNNFGGVVGFASTQTNLRDVQLRNVNAGATVPTLAGVTNLRNLTLQFDNAPITLPSLTASGNVNAVAGGAITQTGAVTVAGGTTLAAGVNDITLSNAANNFNTVDITSSTNVSVTDTNALNLGASTIGGTLNVTTGGALTQSGVLNVAGATTLTSGANDITLTNGGNNFSIIGITSGNNVALANANALVLGTSTVTGTFNVTNGGALTQSGALNVTGTTTLVGGANDITLNSAGNNFSAVGVTSGNNVTLTDANALTMNTSTVSGNIAVSANNLTIGAPVVSAGGNITLTGVSTVTQSANLTAAGANTVTVTTTTGSITMAAAATTSSGTGTITYTAGTNVTLGSLSTGGGVNVSAGGSVLSAAGSGTNVTAGANSTLQAFNGVVGTQAAPLTVNVAPGTLSIRATTTVAGISAFLTGTVLPGNTLTLLNVPPGLVCFNGCTVPPSNNPFAGVFGLAPSFNLDSVVPWYLHEPSDPPVISVMSTYLPETVVAEAKTDVKSDNQSVAREIPPCFPESACKPGASILTAPADGKDPELPAAK